MKKRMAPLLAVLLALLCACGRAEEPGLEGVWVCEGPTARITLTLDAGGRGTWYCHDLEGKWWDDFTDEVEVALHTAFGAWASASGRSEGMLDTTGNYLLCGGVAFARTDPVRHGSPDPRLTGSWEIRSPLGRIAFIYTADGRYLRNSGGWMLTGPYAVFSGGPDGHDMMLLLEDGDFMSDHNLYHHYYDIVEIDGVEHLRVNSDTPDFEDPMADMIRIGIRRFELSGGGYMLDYCDETGLRERLEYYDPDDSLIGYTIYCYEEGRLARVETYERGGGLRTVVDF